MAPKPPIRASDADRERVVQLLNEHSVQGRLDFEELDERLGAAYTAKTRDELADLVQDLPVTLNFAGAEPAPAHPETPEPPVRRANPWPLALRSVPLLPVALFIAIGIALLAGVGAGVSKIIPIVVIILVLKGCHKRGSCMRRAPRD